MQAGRMGSWRQNSTLFKELMLRCPAVANITYNWHPGEHPKDASSTCQYGARASPSIEGKNAERVVPKSNLSVVGAGVGHEGRGGGGQVARIRGGRCKGDHVSGEERHVKSYYNAGKVFGELGDVVAVRLREMERPRDKGGSESTYSGGGEGGEGDGNLGDGNVVGLAAARKAVAAARTSTCWSVSPTLWIG